MKPVVRIVLAAVVILGAAALFWRGGNQKL